ncbi:MAG: ComEC/Rec2 family competence protein [Treponema sp.]|jgi:competence protein ComEC|nr:ComEC/Rec2 family competence protein [Treponema sp.]
MASAVKMTPILCAALCAAASYYVVPHLSPAGALRGVLVSLGAAACLTGFLQTLLLERAFFSHVKDGEDKQNAMRTIDNWVIDDHMRVAQIYVIAATLGFFTGFTSGRPLPVNTGLPPSNIRGIYGVMQDDPRVLANERGTRGMGTITVRRTRGINATEASASGAVSVFFLEDAIPRLKEFGRGGEVYLEGEFLTDAAQASLFRARSVHIVQPAPKIERFRTGLRLVIAERFSRYRWGGLALALLFGIKDSLDSTLSKQYQAAGCSHVLALSGMHLAVVSAVIAFFLKKPLGLKVAALLGAIFITGYIFLVGDMPSLNRSAIMYLLGTATLLFSLPNNTLSILGMAFIIQIIMQPASGASLSFILSYLALAGILALSEPVYALFRGKLPDFLGQSLAASIAAFLATAGVSATFFGVINPFGVIAGLVVVPLTTVFMLGSMLTLALAFTAPVALTWVGAALSIFYQGLERVVSWAAIPPGVKAHPAPVLLASLAIIALVFGVQRLRMRFCLRVLHSGARSGEKRSHAIA